jgi:hypothetical protein
LRAVKAGNAAMSGKPFSNAPNQGCRGGFFVYALGRNERSKCLCVKTSGRNRGVMLSMRRCPNHPDQVLTFIEWCQLNRISERTGRRILRGPNPPDVTMLSPKRFGIATGYLIGSPTAKDCLRVVFLGMIGPIILSAVGPIYYGYTHEPYLRVIVWALAVTVAFLWWARPSFKYALSTGPTSVVVRALNIVAIVLVAAIGFVIGDSLLYFLVRALH